MITDEEYGKLERQLAAAQALLRQQNTVLEEHGFGGVHIQDTDALAAAIAEATKHGRQNTMREAAKVDSLRSELAAAQAAMQSCIRILNNPKFDGWDRKELLKALHLAWSGNRVELDAAIFQATRPLEAKIQELTAAWFTAQERTGRAMEDWA